jgi:hypothetical protein
VQIEYCQALFCFSYGDMQASSHPQLKTSRVRACRFLALHIHTRERCTRSQHARACNCNLSVTATDAPVAWRPTTCAARATIVDTRSLRIKTPYDARIVYRHIPSQIESTFIKTREFNRAINNFMCKKSMRL